MKKPADYRPSEPRPLPVARDGITVAQTLARRRFRFDNEKDLQAGIALALTEDGIEFDREVPLGAAGVVDFMVAGGVAVEVKTDGSPVDVLRQLIRYAERAEVREIVLVTTQSRLGHLAHRRTICNKPSLVVGLWKGFL